MSPVWIALGLAELVWIGVVVVSLLLERRSPTSTVAWIFGLSFLPIIGVLVYLVLGPRRFLGRKRRRRRAREAVAGTVSVLRGAGDAHSDELRRMMAMAERASGYSGRPRTADVRLYTSGREKYRALEEAISSATHHVHLEYYWFEPDTIGTRLRDRLVDAAKRGIEVRLLVDGFASSRASDPFFDPLRAAGGEIARFNPVGFKRVLRFRMANFRTHRKIVVCDGRVGFVGGMNIVAHHSDDAVGELAWRDTHVRLEGPAVRGLQLVFFEDWHYATGRAPDGPRYLPTDLAERESVVQIVASGPDENLDAIHKFFFAAIAGAKRRVLLTSPYFVPDEPLLGALQVAALRGADVRILVPLEGDVPFVAAAARSYYKDLLPVGVRIFEYGPPNLHAKTLVIDDDIAVVGTANADSRSFHLNFEVVAAVYDPSHAARLAHDFEADLARAVEVTLERVEREPFRDRLFQGAARLFSPVL